MTEMTASTPSGGAGTCPRRLVRTPDGKVAGVAAGIAHYLGLDPTIVRIAFLALIFAGGAGLVLYGACWLAMPKGEAPTAGASPAAVDPWLLAAVAALVLGIGLLFGWDGLDAGFKATAGVALVGVGLWLLLRDRHRRTPPPAAQAAVTTPVAPAPGPETAAPGADQPAEPATETAAATWEPAETQAPAAVAVPERRGPITAGVLSALSVVLAALLAGGLAGWLDLSVATALAVALVVVGAGLVFASVLGRTRWLLAIGALLTAALLGAAAVEPLVDDGIGNHTVAPTTIRELDASTTRGIGKLTLDLTAVQPFSGRAAVKAHLGIGHLLIVIPEGMRAVIDAHVGAGDIRFPDGREQDGFHSDATYDSHGSGGTVVIDASVGVGDLEVIDG